MTTTTQTRYERVLALVTPILLADGWGDSGYDVCKMFSLVELPRTSMITIWDDLTILTECRLSSPAVRRAITAIWSAVDAEGEES